MWQTQSIASACILAALAIVGTWLSRGDVAKGTPSDKGDRVADARGSIGGERANAEWVKSDDGVLALRVEAERLTIGPGDPIVLIATVKNISLSPINVLPPGGDWYATLAGGVAIHGPVGKLRYTGAKHAYSLGNCFVRLESGQSVTQRTIVDAKNFKGILQSGNYCLRFTHESGYSHALRAAGYGFEDLWTGKIVGEDIDVQRTR